MNVECPLCRGRKTSVQFDLDGHDCVRCGDCTLQFLHPQPTAETLQALYDKDYYAPWLRGEPDESVAAMKRLTFGRYLRLLRRYRPGGRLLDVGCAFGAMLQSAAGAGYEPFGVELNPAAVEKAGRHCQNVHCGRLSEARYDDEMFDVVTMTDFLEHVRDPLATLAEARRVMKPGGVLLITTPNSGSPLAKLLGRRWIHYKLEHLFYFNRRTLRRLLGGFEILRIQPAAKYLRPVYLGNVLQRYSSRGLLRALGATSSALGKWLWNPAIPLRAGELLAVARRPAREGH